MAGNINGFSVAYTAFGALLVYSGIKGTTLATTFQDLTKGQLASADQENVSKAANRAARTEDNQLTQSSPSTSPSSTAPPGDTGAGTATAAANQALGKTLALTYGWSTGTEWEDLVSLWNQESGWSNTAENPTSGAYGIAQALGHGTNGAPYPSTYQQANPPQYGGSSDALEQIAWGLSYIKSTYGSPEMAWAHEVQNDWY